MKLYLYTVVLILFVGNTYGIRSLFHNKRLQKFRTKRYESNLTETNYDIKWFEQNLDHADLTNQETWQQRYFVGDRYFNQTNRTIVFLMISGEGELEDYWMNWGTWSVNLSNYFSAMFIQLEHRFYGNSKPKKDLSLKNLKYLNSEQALADVANFITKVNITFEHLPQWVVFGGSYAGSLSAWFKQKYPHLVKGAVASSAPIKAMLDFPQYFENVAIDLDNISENCSKVIEKATIDLESLLASSSGRKYINEHFKLCSPLEDTNGNSNTTRFDIMNLFNSLASNFADIAQYNNEMESNHTLEWVCSILTNNTNNKTELEKMAIFNQQMLEYNQEDCLGYKFTDMIDDLRNLTYGGEAMERQWIFQTCNEFGFYQTSSNGTAKIFGDKFPLELYTEMCVRVYGEEFETKNIEEAIAQTNNVYGGLDYSSENVLFLYGSVDPWHSLGLLESLNNKTKTILIKGTAHCADMNPPEESDVQELIEARNYTKVLIESWLD